MQFTEMGRDDGKTLVLLPGTACTWQVNFARVVDALAERKMPTWDALRAQMPAWDELEARWNKRAHER